MIGKVLCFGSFEDKKDLVLAATLMPGMNEL
jgi:hypothetical protein